jgi:hypothetical protein
MATTPDTPSTSDPVGSTPVAKGPAAPSGKASGRFTPKGAKDPGVLRPGGAPDRSAASSTTGRYTPPAVREVESVQLTKPWVPWIMFAMFAIGLICIVCNYLGLLPSAPSNWYLLGGIVAISGGFLAATQLY